MAQSLPKTYYMKEAHFGVCKQNVINRKIGLFTDIWSLYMATLKINLPAWQIHNFKSRTPICDLIKKALLKLYMWVLKTSQTKAFVVPKTATCFIGR